MSRHRENPHPYCNALAFFCFLLLLLLVSPLSSGCLFHIIIFLTPAPFFSTVFLLLPPIARLPFAFLCQYPLLSAPANVLATLMPFGEAGSHSFQLSRLPIFSLSLTVKPWKCYETSRQSKQISSCCTFWPQGTWV